MRILAVVAATMLASLTVLAQGRQSTASPAAAADARKVVFEMQDALGMLRGLQQIDAVNRIEYWGTAGAVASQGRPASLSKFRVSIITATYSEYGDWNDNAKADVFLPRHLVQKKNGVTEFDLTLEHTNTYNPYVIMPVPDNVSKAAGR